ncbi:MAG: protein kinase [Verrucomicrobiales bacterium]
MNNSEPGGGVWVPPSAEELQRMLPQYEITGILGSGGMGAVYQGRQAQLNRPVAIKLLPETLIGDGDEFNFAARFRQEAQTMASLDHPAIVSVYDFGETANGQVYFVMEFIDGMDIHQYLHHHGGALPQEQALAIVCHVLDALDYAHGHGIVHRDIKPANVLLNQEGRVKIADFGLAKTLAGAAGDEPAAPALTMTNMAMGTPDYAAPEMLELGTTPDHRVDLYAVGVMLYQLLTGKLPRGSFQKPSELQAALDPRLDGVVSQAMAADPDHRYSRASEIRTAIDEVLSRPMTRVEGGQEESEAPAAVSPGEVRKAGGPKKKAAAATKSGSSDALWWGLGIGGVAVVVAAAFFMAGGGDKPKAGDGAEPLVAAVVPKPKAASQADSKPEPEPEPEPASEPEPKPVAANAARPEPHAEPEPASEPEPKPVAANAARPEPHAEPEPKPSEPATEPKPAPEVTVAEAGPDSPPKSGTSSQPVPPAPSPPDSPASEPAPAADTTATPEPTDPLVAAAAIPGVEPRLRGYLKARSEAVEKLAAGYLRALERRLNQAADAGNLTLATAWREEKARVAALQDAGREQAGDLLAEVSEWATLPELPDDAPEGLLTLRKTWQVERRKIHDELDTQLQVSLKTLETELTQQRKFDQAEAVQGFRESLAGPAAGTSPVMANATPEAPSDSADAPAPLLEARNDADLENPFGWRGIPKEPFPLPTPQRPTTPCRVVAWRLDGKPMDESGFREGFGGVPADLGEVVDFEASSQLWPEIDVLTQYPLGLTPDGLLVAMKPIKALEDNASKLTGIVRMDVGAFVGIALREDGKAVGLEMRPSVMRNSNATLDEVLHWPEVVQVRAGGAHLLGLTAAGDVHGAGSNIEKQLDLPAGTDTGIVSIDAYSPVTWTVQDAKNGWMLRRLGSINTDLPLDRESRFFLGPSWYAADARGRLNHSGTHSEFPASHENLQGARTRDLRMIEVSQGTIEGDRLGVAAACEGEDRWRFWGNLGNICEVDTRYCEERAAGCWKVFLIPPYALALKPAVNLKPHDWTGAEMTQ